ncbi:MAG TPA: hypothetical protein VD969_11085 [Symbiobacteriaceae bacterium]|nr:hypothetical protein [Symbiobacteriaceae bacterium]
MQRTLSACVVFLLLLSAFGSAGAAAPPDIRHLLPAGATVVVTVELDLTGDGRPELLVGYTLPREGLPPTLGRAAVLERDSAGGLLRFDLAGTWPGHYPPRFTATDMTGDGRPELVERAGGGGAWGTLRVFRRAAEAYEMLLEDHAQDHVLWDADGDGRLEVIARKRTRYQEDQLLQRFVWRDGRFVAWHAPEWSYSHTVPAGTRLPGLKGFSVKQADQALVKAGYRLGVIAALDRGMRADRVLRYQNENGQVHVAVSAGNTKVSLPPLLPVSGVYYVSDTAPGTAPVAMTDAQRTRWHGWLSQLMQGVQQAVYTRYLSHTAGPIYFVELQAPWTVKLGDRTQTVRWVGVGTRPPYLGLLFMAPGLRRSGWILPDFLAAIYTTRSLPPAPVPAEQPLASYLNQHPEVDAFVTIWPEEWPHAVRLRGIAPDGWPAPDFAPHLEGAFSPDPDTSPIPGHVMATVLNGFVRRASRQGDDVTVQVVAAPGRVYRWPLPLTGFDRSTRAVRVHLEVPGQAAVTREVPLEGWRSWSGDPGPGSWTRE